MKRASWPLIIAVLAAGLLILLFVFKPEHAAVAAVAALASFVFDAMQRAKKREKDAEKTVLPDPERAKRSPYRAPLRPRGRH